MKFNKRKVWNKIAYSKNTASAKSIHTHKKRMTKNYIMQIIYLYIHTHTYTQTFTHTHTYIYIDISGRIYQKVSVDS